MSEYIKPERDGKPTGDGRDSLPSRTLPASVLVVDDDEHLRDGYRRLLTKAGFGTLALPSAEAALARLRNGEPFDVIVSDIVMPGTDGIALLRQVREHDLDIPVILVTGNPSLMSAVETVRYGGFRYLVKPVSPTTLIASVRDAIQLHRLARLKCEALKLLSFDCEQLGDRASLETGSPWSGSGSHFSPLSRGAAAASWLTRLWSGAPSANSAVQPCFSVPQSGSDGFRIWAGPSADSSPNVSPRPPWAPGFS